MISPKKRLLYEDLTKNTLWEVTSLGEIFRHTGRAGQLLSAPREQSFYLKEGRYYFKYHQVELSVHLAVLAVHDRLPSDTEMTLHQDGDITNNCVTNLKIIPKLGNCGKKLTPAA